MVKNPSLLDYLTMIGWEKRRDGFMPFPEELAPSETQTA